MADWSEVAPYKRAPMLGWGLGLFAGGFESIRLAVTLKQSMTFGEGALLGLTAAGLGGLMGLTFGVLAGVIVTVVSRSWLNYRRHALSMALVALGLALWYLVPAAKGLLDQSRPQAAIAFALTPIGVGGVIWFNAVFWLRREYVNGSSPRLGWWFWSLLGAAVLSGFTGWRLSQRNLTAVAAIETDPDVLIVTIDALRQDRAFGPDGVMPAVQALADAGVRYDNAITPMPESLPAHSAVLTGLHPARNKALSNGHRLSAGYETLPERVGEEGYTTGAFVSSAILSAETGLDQGFQVYDDDFSTSVRSLYEIQSVRLALRAAAATVGDPVLLERQARPAAQTLARATRWLTRNNDRPAFAWVHLSDLQGVHDPADYDARAAELDQQIGAFVTDIDARDNARALLLIVAGAYGTNLGDTGSHGLYDEVIRVPLLIHPVRMARSRRVVPEQVRLMDLLTTTLRQLRLDPPEKTESGDLIKFTIPADHRGFSSLLIGRQGPSLSETALYGYRARNTDGGDIKYLVELTSDREELYNLNSDPAEDTNLAENQPDVAGALKSNIQKELAVAGIKAETLQPEADGLRLQLLRALGYAP
ncbi:MAG: sulfatase-like hydrolase/transferase [Myxococcota bacterium]